MTPKEKARELISVIGKKIGKEFKNGSFKYNIENAKQCALIAVDEILYLLNEIDSTEQWNASYFYNQVKQEIEKL